VQPLIWYWRRLRSMPPEEMAWRTAGLAQVVADRCRMALGAYPSDDGFRTAGSTQHFEVSDLAVGGWARAEAGSAEAAWRDRVCRQADAVAAHRLAFLGLDERDLGDPIDWNRDHEVGKPCPLRFSPAVDYRQYEEVGDAKVVWEPNRHHQLVVLGRAYRASGEVRHARAVVEQIDSWLEQCPFGRGMNWRSPLELAIRMINWVWALELVRGSGLLGGQPGERIWRSIHLHLWEITRKYSRGSSANNHRIGEAAGVFVATSCWPVSDEARRWRAESHDMLCQEILKQTHPDGGSREQAVGYHLFVLQFLLIAGVVGRQTGFDFPASYWQRLEKMLEFLGALSEGGQALPLFGDCDDGHVLDLGGGAGDARSWLAVGAVLFGRPDFKAWAGAYPETARWLLGASSRAGFDALTPPESPQRLQSRAFQDSGYYLLQAGTRGAADALSVVFDCGELGFKSIAAHGHADALSFTLRAGGQDVLVDPGTYDYFRFPAWREYFRSTRAHNTVTVDGADQSAMQGPFLWGARAVARCLAWQPTAAGGGVTGEHDGYARLRDPVVHRRTLELDGRSRLLSIRDEIHGRGTHEVSVHFHLSEQCRFRSVAGHRLEIAVGGGTVTLEMDPRLRLSTLFGSERPIAGWVSRRYHQKMASPTVVGRAACCDSAEFICRVRMNDI
jgi:hypothetical protein